MSSTNIYHDQFYTFSQGKAWAFSIGVIQNGEGSGWVYSTNNEQLAFTPWASGQPSGDGSCVAVNILGSESKVGKWNDLKCTVPNFFVCESQKVA